MKITLVRHGETIENAEGIIQGHSQGHLSETGRVQASEAAKKLKNEMFDIAISSDLKRCIDTAKAILKYHPELELQLEPSLREMNFGDYQGLKNSDVDWDALSGDVLNRKAPNGESGTEMRLRILKCINELLQKYPDGRVLLITHSGPIRAVKATVEGIDQIESLALPLENCSIHTYLISEPLSLNL